MQFFFAELRRLLQQRTVWLTIACSLLVWGVLLFRGRNGIAGLQAWWHIYHTNLESFRLVLPLLVSIVVGTSMVDDRASGFIRYVFYRGVSRTRYLFTKLFAGACVAAIVAGVPLLVLGYFILQIGSPVNDTLTGLPLPRTFSQSNTAVILWSTLSAMLGGIFFFALGSVAAVLTKNRYIVTATPLLFHLLIVATFPIDLIWLAPNGVLALRDEHIGPRFMVLYWLVAISSCIGLMSLIVVQRERID